MRFSTTEDRTKAATRNRARTEWRKNHPASDPETRYGDSPIRFVMVDGEGVGNGTDHRYVLIGVGQDYLANPEGLRWEEIFQFLYNRFEDGGVAYCGYYLSYDFTQWLKTLPEYEARRLITASGRASRQRHIGKRMGRQIMFPQDCGDWEFDILGTKRLKLRPKGSKRWMHICDAGPFFQTSLLRAIDPKNWTDPIVSDAEFEKIRQGKERRSTAVLDSEMIEYMQLENEVGARLLGELQTGFRALNVYLKPSEWFGPGQATEAWLKRHTSIPTSEELPDLVPADFLSAAIGSYYGGWFEIMAHGIVSGLSYEYDINSAYPWVISHLPCLRHGAWTSGTGRPVRNHGDFTLVYAEIDSYDDDGELPDDQWIGSMLHRSETGDIVRPCKTEGWFWLHELSAAVRANCVRHINYVEWHNYSPCDCPPPARDIASIYNLRLKVGKKTPLGIAAKLIANSFYGKSAQSVGHPTYGNPVYASLITSGCRAKILDAIATHPEGQKAVLMVATDGVYFRTPHPGLHISKDLGDWDYAEHSNLCLFKPGIYWDDKAREIIAEGNAPQFKSRGINPRDFASSIERIDQIFGSWAKETGFHPWPLIKFTTAFSMVTATQALARGKWDLAGAVYPDVEMEQSADPCLKRDTYFQPVFWDEEFQIFRSTPWTPRLQHKSTPYTKRFGLEDPFSTESNEEFGITPDGSVKDTWSEVIIRHDALLLQMPTVESPRSCHVYV